MIEVEVIDIEVDRESGVSVLCLQGKQQRLSHEIKITIGPFEAKAIAYQMSNQRVPRPMTHDLLKHLIDGLEASLARVVIEDLRDGIFYAHIFLTTSERSIRIDARPSDAIALAVRADAPIFVTEEVVSKAGTGVEAACEPTEAGAGVDEAGLEEWKKWIENVTPEDFANPTG